MPFDPEPPSPRNPPLGPNIDTLRSLIHGVPLPKTASAKTCSVPVLHIEAILLYCLVFPYQGSGGRLHLPEDCDPWLTASHREVSALTASMLQMPSGRSHGPELQESPRLRSLRRPASYRAVHLLEHPVTLHQHEEVHTLPGSLYSPLRRSTHSHIPVLPSSAGGDVPGPPAALPFGSLLRGASRSGLALVAAEPPTPASCQPPSPYGPFFGGGPTEYDTSSARPRNPTSFI